MKIEFTISQIHYNRLMNCDLILRLRVTWVNLSRFLGEVKKLKGLLMGILVFKYSNVKVQLLRQHWMHFVRDHSARWMVQMRPYKQGLFR